MGVVVEKHPSPPKECLPELINSVDRNSQLAKSDEVLTFLTNYGFLIVEFKNVRQLAKLSFLPFPSPKKLLWCIHGQKRGRDSTKTLKNLR